MSDRQKIVSRLTADRDFRANYIRAKLEVLIPSQLRALRLREEKTQSELAQLADMKQARISAMETPGRVNFNLETLVRMAATHSCGLLFKFVPFSEMLEWENEYSQDTFNVTRLSEDIDFLQPKPTQVGLGRHLKRRRKLTQRSTMSPQSFGNRRSDSLGIQQPFNTEATFQMDFQFESEQHSSSRGLVEMVKQIPSTGAVNFSFRNTAIGAQPNAANASAT
jgi:transcriptional regulator with XRE-family HTH domain